jgi:mono/diheme cytochrome c family protein
MFSRFHCLLPLILISSRLAAQDTYSFDHAQSFLKAYCQACHQGKSPAGGFNVQTVNSPATLESNAQKWIRLNTRIIHGEMPPKGAPTPNLDSREHFTNWVEGSLRTAACSTGMRPGPAHIRRLNRDEYTATVRDLFDIHLDIGRAFPADGAGGEGFDNAAETLFLSPLHSEKYLEVAKFALDFAAKEYKSHAKIFVAKPGSGVSPDQAATVILQKFLPRAFRRPVTDAEVTEYLGLFQAAQKQGREFDSAVLFALRSALVSPMFLFHVEPPNNTTDTRLLDGFALASRLSYFLWGSMPDEFLFDVAASGKLQDPEVLKQVIPRMLRNDRSLTFAERFVEQWLRTRELSADKIPDAKLFPSYANDEDLRSDIRFQPILFFRELILRDMSLLNLLDSKYTIGTSNLEKHYGVRLPLNKNARTQPQWVELPDYTHRGGLLGMAAVLTVSSYPYRTSPVLRGAWILDSILGTPPPPPPPNVPKLEETAAGAAPKSVRERLTQHRANPACASCHSRIDGLGFALENYDPIGRWREEDSGSPVDTSGALQDGTKFIGPDELKTALLQRKDLFLRNLTSKMLGYALGRGLTLSDSCTVDSIVAKLKDNNYSARALVEEIVLSVPFRQQAPGAKAQERQ